MKMIWKTWRKRAFAGMCMLLSLTILPFPWEGWGGIVRAAEDNLLNNGGFETLAGDLDGGWTDFKADGWKMWKASGNATVTATDQESHEGTRSLLIRAEQNAKTTVSNVGDVQVTPEEHYRLSGWVKREDVSSKVFLRVYFKNEAGQQLSYEDSAPLSGSGDWQLVEQDVQAPAGAVKANVNAYFDTGKGTAWFDELSLKHYVPERSIALSGAASLVLGETTTLTLNANYENAPLSEAQWSSSDPQVAAVDGQGTVAALSAGQAVISAVLWDEELQRQYQAELTIQVADGYPDLMQNGGFEDTDVPPSDSAWSTLRALVWGNPWLANGSPAVAVDDQVGFSGSKSARITAQVPSRATVGQKVDVESGAYYRVSARIKTDNMQPSAFLRIYFDKADGTSLGFTDTPAVGGTKDWTYIEAVVQAPSEAARAGVTLYFPVGTGTAWFDDIGFHKIVPPEKLSFESRTGFVGVHERLILDPVFTPAYTTERGLTWTSSDETVATVADGVVTGVSAGSVAIEAQTADGRLTARTILAVGAEPKGLDIGDVSVSTPEGQAISGALPAADSEGAALVYYLLDAPTQGVLHLEKSGTWTYYPNEGYRGADSFTVAAASSDGGLGVATVSVGVAGVNRAPSMDTQIVSVPGGTVYTGSFQAADPDGDAVSYSIAAQPDHGSLELDGAAWRYTPGEGYLGYDRFTVLMTDSAGNTAQAEQALMVVMGRETIAGLLAAPEGEQRPRVIAGDGDFERIQSLLTASDPYISSWYAKVQARADRLLETPPSVYEFPDGVRLLDVSREVLDRVESLAMMYRLTGDVRYADRAWLELEAVSAFPDWNPAHFLDTAEMTAAVAIGYDWLHDYWTPAQQSALRLAIVEKGLEPALPYYRNNLDWAQSSSNWNSVVNGGLGMGALAIAGDDPAYADLVSEVLANGIRLLPLMIEEYAPDGAWREGPTYWEYGTSYLAYFLSSLENRFGSDMGFCAMPGLAETASFPMHMTGPGASFNFADAVPLYIHSPVMLWLADTYNNPGYAWYHKTMADQVSSGVLDMIWYRPELYAAAQPPQQLDAYFSQVETAAFRSAWDDDNAAYVAFKAGDNQATHGDLDIGTFVFDALGYRWVSDLGLDDYNLPGYWENGSNGTRWNFYRKRAEGHNTLLINPGGGPDQEPFAKAVVEGVHSGETEAWSVMDITPAYQKDAVSVKRGLRLDNGRSELLVQDEIQNKTYSDVRWQIHTQARAELSPDGKTVTLRMLDRSLQLKLQSPSDAVFYIAPAEPLPTSPNPAGQSSSSAYTVVGIYLPHTLKETVAVRMIPLMPGQQPEEELPPVVPLAQWSLSGQSMSELAGISVDHTPLADFQSLKRVYEVKLQEGAAIPEITAAGKDPGTEVTVTPPAVLPGAARIQVKAPGKFPNEYYVDFTIPQTLGLPAGKTELPVAAVTANHYDQSFVPENTLDGSLDTDSRWTGVPGDWIRFDLGEVKRVDGIAIAFMSGNARKTIYDLEVSEDGENWKTLINTASTGETLDYEYTDLKGVTARYVRILGYGNTVSQYTSITEVKLFGSDPEEPPDDSDGSASPDEPDVGGSGGDTRQNGGDTGDAAASAQEQPDKPDKTEEPNPSTGDRIPGTGALWAILSLAALGLACVLKKVRTRRLIVRTKHLNH